VDSRVRKVADGLLDAVVVAYAGLLRLGRESLATEAIDPLLMLPAPAQGALAVECRDSDATMLDLLAGLDHPYSRISVQAERALLATLEAGCSAPVGALAEVVEGEDGLEVSLRATVLAADGTDSRRLSASGPLTDAIGIGQRLARVLIEDGAADLMGARDDARA
jgi:hydroxymethylbilane synthase